MLTNRPIFLTTAALILQVSALAAAQDSSEKIWGVFSYTLYGDSTPKALASPGARVLTEYGASALYTAGSAFRARYVEYGMSNAAGTGIQNIEPNMLDSLEVNAFSTPEQFVLASAQAFMQGLYPPLGQSLGSPYSDLTSQLSNGSQSAYPLNGYQYPLIVTMDSEDPHSLALAGQAKCPMHQASDNDYLHTAEAFELTEWFAPFYMNVWRRAMSEVYDINSASYPNAVEIGEYLEYEAVHNDTLMEAINVGDVALARWLADQYIWATNSQTSSSSELQSNVTSIAGQTLASSILQAFDTNIQSQGSEQMMTMLFGGDEPAVALASLLGLATEQQANFFSRPVRGGSLVFELYSYDDSDVPSYPNSEGLFVRFFLHNGTSNDTVWRSYPLFGHGPSRDFIPYNEFREEIETFAVDSTQQWCTLCKSESIFCKGVLGDSTQKKRMAPAVAGVIGAVITLVAIGLLTVIGLLACGVHFRKRGEGGQRSSLGGFKGTNKLASDTDVTFRHPIWGTSKTADEHANGEMTAGGFIVQGHERLGSWEMGQQSKEIENIHSMGQPHPRSAFDEENDEEWRIHSSLKPVKVRESI
ncbi:hypothetical protein N7510_004429 [Penicillium lagena]|uniref:uncharacterized protein n=1 Tax=Penicillium lagena TaxID=94218 RepID=UPI0025408811|nr:uncharacterized protein N7510_004429 [Penicillium lagena]KAJ5620445.1 hypothetical protein N7510_004429 [Penicillium lagena]